MLHEMDGNAMTELLLELFSEEIPAKMQIKAAKQLLATLENEIKALKVDYVKAEYFVTPRRVTLYIDGLPSILPEKFIERKGPKNGSRPEALAGFIRSCGVDLEELEVVDGCYYFKKTEAAKPINASLSAIIEQMLVSFTWPKSMRMNNSRIRWVRPLRNILCLFNNKVLPIKFGDLESNDYSFGHRFMAPDKLVISSFEDYQEKMRNSYVILSSLERKELIIKQIEDLTKDLDVKPVLEESLLNEVVGLVEYPNSLLGQIDKSFIKMPKEVLVSAMKTHQRYFYLEDTESKLAPYFLVVSNIKNDHDNLIRAGNEKVLKARLSDSEFFWESDLKQASSANLAKLSKLICHHKLGSMFDKTNRIISLAEFIGENKLDNNLIKKAALLCKTDLVSEMVGEFPELQGIMGSYYALASNEEEEVALAVAEHYRPIDTNDQGDVSKLGAVIAIADKIDSLVGLWIAGEKPTSSRDPFALRRSALGIIKLIRYHKFDLSLSMLIDHAINNYDLKYDSSLKKEIQIFFNDRLKFYLKAEGIRHDLIMSVIDEKMDDIYNIISNVEDLQQFILKDEASELVFAIKRISNIISAGGPVSYEVDESLFGSTERDLYHSYLNVKLSKKCEDLLPMVKCINKFFDDIMVNDEDNSLKQNRLNLLNNILQVSKNIADFNLIEV
jgi:glycyl-tRNA synthetase beta chain